MVLSNRRDARRLLHLLLSRIDCLRPNERLDVVRCCRNVDSLISLAKDDVEKIIQRKLVRSRWQPSIHRKDAERDFADLTGGRIGCIFFEDNDYPSQLREIYDPPAMLYYRGKRLDRFPVGIALVGTRYPTGRARNAAFDLGWELSSQGASVVSGLARGIDAEAHRGALKGSGYLVGVLGCGLDFIYPRSSERLGHNILHSGGILISEYPPGTPPRKHHFPARNRIISGLARATVVIQAPASSGALITADCALDQGRDVYVHASGMDGSTGAGGRNLAGQGAPVIGSAAELMQHGEPTESESGPALSSTSGLSPARQLELEMRGRLVHHNGRYSMEPGEADQ
jgi:DNA processing protein